MYSKQIRIMVLGALLGFWHTSEAQKSSKKPNIILILADDLGYSDLGAYGSEIQTPNLDRLAHEGTRFTQFYNNSICAPSRATLLTGQYQHKAGVGYFSQDLGSPAYQGYINANSLTLAEVLKLNGYQTLLSGKWHINGRGVSYPWQRGFDHSMMSENGSYFDQGGFAGGPDQPYFLDGKPYPLKAGTYYQTDLITDHAIKFLDQASDDKPFFLYLAYTAPHWPLHALPEDISRYKGRYDLGWDELRKERIKRQTDLGILAKEVVPAPSDNDIYDWSRLSFDQRKSWSAKMEVFAAMVDRMDQNIGKLLTKLKEMHADENTLIVFMADNGAPAEDLEKWFGGAIRNTGPVGTAGSYESQSKNWSWVSNSPFKEYKDYMYEGGINSPFIVWYPGKVSPGRITRGTGHFIDIAPTFYQLAGAKYPESYNRNKAFPLPGKSLLPVLYSNKEVVERSEPLFWERAGNRAVRLGKWKLLSTWPSHKWELYDMEADPTELNDVAAANHEVVSKLSTKYFQWAKENGVVDFSILEDREPKMMKEYRKSKIIESVPYSNGL